MADLPLETVVAVPNSAYISQAIFQTALTAGRQVVSCQIHLAAMNADLAKNQRTFTGQTGMVYIPDLSALEGDIAGEQRTAADLLALLETLAANVNRIRKLL